MVREIRRDELPALLRLYLHLHETEVPEITPEAEHTWESILNSGDHHVLVCEEDGKLVSSCVCVIIPNLTRGFRPYALIENVVTDPSYRRRGFAAACLSHAETLAREANCYKLMLLTGAKDEGTLHFYERAGFNRKDKTAFIRRL